MELVLKMIGTSESHIELGILRYSHPQKPYIFSVPHFARLSEQYYDPILVMKLLRLLSNYLNQPTTSYQIVCEFMLYFKKRKKCIYYV